MLVSSAPEGKPKSPPSGDLPTMKEKKDDDFETIIVFDWDDTLLASTWLASRDMRLDGPAVLPSEIKQELVRLEHQVFRLLELARSVGDTVIITNAETGWVELSAEKFLPRVAKLLEETAIPILSARSIFEAKHPASPKMWKTEAITAHVNDFVLATHPRKKKNIISFGDSVHERDAVIRAAAQWEKSHNVVTKSIKFVERPSADQLRRQVELVESVFDNIFRHEGNLDLMLTIQMAAAAGKSAGK